MPVILTMSWRVHANFSSTYPPFHCSILKYLLFFVGGKLVEEGGAMVELIEKVTIHLTKILLSLLEMHPNSFLTFIGPSLSFSVSLILSPETEPLLFPRFVVQCFNIIKGVLLCDEYKVSLFLEYKITVRERCGGLFSVWSVRAG